ncbi:2'-5' RNA ligase family protein [Rufibacter psychrotolerans]|uniref:2'-5' RNA ligase family protein n=1 Tax=Rufibacter psychrotolerans TaxID=2812556 RepID=UPI001967F265|nr:2'-5' RNA ligase family protein [Rufibacter sp. SYSU D00308]
MEPNPLILTLTLDQEAAAFFTALRIQHFPPERNYLQAHLTLFHKLPAQEESIGEVLSTLSRTLAPLPLQVTDLMSLGRGVAYRIASEELQHLHKTLQAQWGPFLSPQDKQKLRPHITIQNKVAPAVAKELEQTLRQTFTPFSIKGTGFTLWEYLGGPWGLLREFPFTAQESPG